LEGEDWGDCCDWAVEVNDRPRAKESAQALRNIGEALRFSG
jgi:hypothetical protein